MYLLYLKLLAQVHSIYVSNTLQVLGGYLPNMRFLLKNLHKQLEVFFVSFILLTFFIFREQLRCRSIKVIQIVLF